MKKVCSALIISLILCSGCQSYKPKPFTVDFTEPELDIYQIASWITGCPERILRGIAFAESSYNQDATGDDGISTGRFQINEKFHVERAKKYGEYSPFCPLDTAILTGRLYMDNLKTLGNERDAIAAHKQGASGVRDNGRAEWYVNRVLKAI